MWSLLAAAASEEWDGDEVMLLIGSLGLSVVGIAAWARWLSWAGGLGREEPWIGSMVLALLVSLGLLGAVTWFWTAREIRHGQPYTWLVLLMGTAWLTLWNLLFRWAGVGVGEDACERRNRAASLALSGGMIGAMLVFCGANTGEGPSFWNNVFSAALGGLVWFTLWVLLEATAGISRSVTEDRDVAAGLRLAGFLVAEGLILGRALAGNWHSAGATVTDFARDGWVSAVLLATAALVERKSRPSATHPSPAPTTHGALPALMYVCLAVVWVLKLGWWEGAPK